MTDRRILAVSWGAWPRADQDRITTEEDDAYKSHLRGKAYMMGVSPWFYTSRSPSVMNSKRVGRFCSQFDRTPTVEQELVLLGRELVV